MSEPQASVTVLNRDQVRAVDRIAMDDFGIPGIVLMENAGRGISDRICELGLAGPVVILCGRGNNGGDGYVVARQLVTRGFDVSTVSTSPGSELSGDTAINCRINDRLGIERIEVSLKDDVGFEAIRQLLDRADWIVDALLGTGASGAPRDLMAKLIGLANEAPGRRLAIDIPSGLDCDTGETPGAVFRADYTATLAALKPALVNGVSRCAGVVSVHDIGIPKALIRDASRKIH